MKKFLCRLLLLLLVFAAGVAGTAFLLNSETTDDRSDMNNPVLPEVMIDVGGIYANRMYGYAQEMQADFTRDSVTPLDTSKELKFVINGYDTKVSSLAYEIRTSDGMKVLENRKIKNLGEEDGYLTASVTVNSSLRVNQEYSMQITLETSKGTAYYYTRVVSRSGLNVDQYVKFVKSFYEKSMDKASAEDLTSYLEPVDTGASANYNDVNINSTFNQISWGSLSPQIYKKGIPVIKDINETTASISLEYQIMARDGDSAPEIYDVTEFYRMRYTSSRIMLLDFERSASQVFDENNIKISQDGLLLGVRSRDVDYMTNETAGVAAFVQEGDLWSFGPEDGKTIRIFSFRRDEGDFRDARNQHNIKIIRVEDNGDVDFVLYGYMNRGLREGYSGLCVYHYSSDQNVVEEKVFIPTTESYEFLKEDLGTLSYVSKNNQLFLLFSGKLYRVDIDKGDFQVMEEQINPSQFVVSDTNAHAAWTIQEGENAGCIKEIQFDTLDTRILTGAAGQSVKPVGFMNEDLVYGVVMDGDALTDDDGHVTEGIHTLRIEGFDGEIKKEYHQEGLYITNVTIGSTLMEFELSAKQGNTYVVQKNDNIMNNKKAGETQAEVELVSNSRTGTQVRLSFSSAPEVEEALVVYAKMKSGDENKIVLDTQVPQDEIYYVYAKGGLDSTFTDPGQAVKHADDLAGVVLNRAQQYVWERGNKKTKITLNIEDVPEVMRTGSMDLAALQQGMGDQGTVIDLSGCTLDSVLYEVSAQRPVIAKTGNNTSVVIIGYDEYNTWLYDPATGETQPYGMNDSTALFEKAGNIFVSYIENIKDPT